MSTHFAKDNRDAPNTDNPCYNYAMKPYNYILLDWDGSIAQTLNLWPDALDIVLSKQGVALKRNELVEACGGVAAFLASHTQLSETEGRVVLEDATEIVKQRLPYVELYPDALDVLSALRNDGKHLALITSSVRPVVAPLLEKFGLNELFEAAIYIEDTNNRKPHPEPLRKALKLLGGTEAEAIMIGDTAKDINAAENAGVDSVLFYPVEHQAIYDLDKLMKHKPTYVISEFWDLVKLVQSI